MKNSIKSQFWLMMCAALALSGCAGTPQEERDGEETSAVLESEVNDPFEGFNRTMWTINYDYLDPYIVRPAAVAYVDYTPSPIRTGIANFLGNLDEPSSIVNNILMGNGAKAVDHFNRFWINSTFGLLGLIDIASAAGIT